MAVTSGIVSSGGNVFDIGECLPSALEYAMKLLDAEIGCYADCEVTGKLQILSRGGLPLTRGEERKISAGINRSEYSTLPFTEYGKITKVNANTMYIRSIENTLKGRLDGIFVNVSSPNSDIAELSRELLEDKNDPNGERVIFNITSDGKKCSAYSEKTGHVIFERLVLICLRSYFEKGRAVAIPFTFPKVAEAVADEYSVRFTVTLELRLTTRIRKRGKSQQNAHSHVMQSLLC